MGNRILLQKTDHNRRRFLGTTAMTIAAAHLGMMRSAHAQSHETTGAAMLLIQPGTNTTFGKLKQIDAKVSTDTIV